jgi:hypothetical protein
MSLAGIRKVGTTMHCWKAGCLIAVNVSTSTYNRSNILAGNKMSDLFIGMPKRGASNLTVRYMFRNYKTQRTEQRRFRPALVKYMATVFISKLYLFVYIVALWVMMPCNRARLLKRLTSDVYSGGNRFESQPAHRILWRIEPLLSSGSVNSGRL